MYQENYCIIIRHNQIKYSRFDKSPHSNLRRCNPTNPMICTRFVEDNIQSRKGVLNGCRFPVITSLVIEIANGYLLS